VSSRLLPALPSYATRVASDDTSLSPVVADDQQQAPIDAQHFFQHLNSREVQVVGRLVENENVGRACQHCREVQATALTTRQRLDLKASTGPPSWILKTALGRTAGRRHHILVERAIALFSTAATILVGQRP